MKKIVRVGDSDDPAGAGAWSSDGEWIVVAGWQRRASVWDTRTGNTKLSIGENLLGTDPLDQLSTSIAGSADGKRIAIGAVSGNIHILNIKSAKGKAKLKKDGKPLKPLYKNAPLPPYPIAFDPKNSDRLLAAYLSSPHLALWKIDEKSAWVFGDDRSGYVSQLAFDPSGEVAATATIDSAVRLWMTADILKSDILKPGRRAKPFATLRGHLAAVFSTDITAADQAAISGFDDGTMRFATGSIDGTIRLWARDAPLSARLLSSPSVSMPPNANNFDVNNFSVHSGKKSVTRNNQKFILPEDFSDVMAAALSEDGLALAVVPRSGKPRLLATIGKEALPVSISLTGIDAEWTSVAFIQNDTRIVAETKDGRIFAWPFFAQVEELEKLAELNLPVMREDDGVDKPIGVAQSYLRRKFPSTN